MIARRLRLSIWISRTPPQVTTRMAAAVLASRSAVRSSFLGYGSGLAQGLLGKRTQWVLAISPPWSAATPQWPHLPRAFGGDKPGTVDQRLRWIGSPGKAKPFRDLTGTKDREPTGTRYFASQPYEQLAAVYRPAKDTEARKVAIARVPTYANTGSSSRTAGSATGCWTRPSNTGTKRGGPVWPWPWCLWPSGRWLLRPAASPDGAGRQFPRARRRRRPQYTVSYPCFYPLGYTVDTVIPSSTCTRPPLGPQRERPVGLGLVPGTAIATGLGGRWRPWSSPGAWPGTPAITSPPAATPPRTPRTAGTQVCGHQAGAERQSERPR